MNNREWQNSSVSIQLCTVGVVLKHVKNPYHSVDPIVKYVKVVGAMQSIPRWTELDNAAMLESLYKLKNNGFITDVGGWQLTESGSIVYDSLCKRYTNNHS